MMNIEKVKGALNGISLNNWIGIGTLVLNTVLLSVVIAKLSSIELNTGYSPDVQNVMIVNKDAVPVELSKIADRDLEWDNNVWRPPFLGLRKQNPIHLKGEPEENVSDRSPMSVEPFVSGGVFVGKVPPQWP
ncbi:hypothetical protein SAMN05444156_2191 [Verrucomicrobium sp. GAS474]|uniref:hypothetical protein n=1 Tax=Verrucomicrobium sp. GAS474 TaxID=1882831 RepID=UPI00087CBC4B|nr:hypothetical protein [Verrucomicrobium sp. GAS474]SDU13914.1 hypothetical protein SAMN05444156_2191 [Verrucomicrobium sp. GAS474]